MTLFKQELKELAGIDHSRLKNSAKTFFDYSLARLLTEDLSTLEIMFPYVKTVNKSTQAMFVILQFLSVSARIDGEYTHEEKQIIQDVVKEIMGSDFRRFEKDFLKKPLTEGEVISLKIVVESIPDDVKKTLCCLSACVLAVDGRMDVKESNYLSMLMK